MLDGLTPETVRTQVAALPVSAHGSLKLVGQSGRIWGAALCSNDSIQRPIYVSVGHRVSLDTAIVVARACSMFRVPEPVRQADKLSRRIIRDAA